MTDRTLRSVLELAAAAWKGQRRGRAHQRKWGDPSATSEIARVLLKKGNQSSETAGRLAMPATTINTVDGNSHQQQLRWPICSVADPSNLTAVDSLLTRLLFASLRKSSLKISAPLANAKYSFTVGR